MLWCQKSIQRPACRLQTGRTGLAWERKFISLSSHPYPYKMDPRGCSPEVKMPVSEADPSFPFSAEDKNARSCAPAPGYSHGVCFILQRKTNLYAFKVACLLYRS